MKVDDLRYWRQLYGYSRADAARRLMVTEATYRGWEKHTHEMPDLLGYVISAFVWGLKPATGQRIEHYKQRLIHPRAGLDKGGG